MDRKPVLVLVEEENSQFDQLNIFNEINESISSYPELILEVIAIKKDEILPCIGCFGCWIKTPGQCIQQTDRCNEISAQIMQSDWVIYLTPVLYGTLGHGIKAMIDRMIQNVLPTFKIINGEMHHRPRYDSYPNFYFVGFGKSITSEEEEIFCTLAQRISVNFHAQQQHAIVVREANAFHDKLQQILREISGRRGQ